MMRLTYFSDGKWRIQLGHTEYSGEKVDQIALYENIMSKCDLSVLTSLIDAVADGRAIVAWRRKEVPGIEFFGRDIESLRALVAQAYPIVSDHPGMKEVRFQINQQAFLEKGEQND